VNEATANRVLVEIRRGIEQPPPEIKIGSLVSVTLPTGTYPGEVTGRLYGPERCWECRVAGALVYVECKDLEIAP